jgi:hypothetical protein
LRKVFFIVAIMVSVISCAAYAATINVDLIARVPGILLVSFNDVTGVDFLGTAVDNNTTIEWADITAQPTDDTETYVETSIYTLKVRSTEPWDLTITGDDVLTNEDGKTIDLEWQYGDTATLAGVSYSTDINVALVDQPATIDTGAYTKYIRFRIPYHWGVYPGTYTGSVSIEAATF